MGARRKELRADRGGEELDRFLVRALAGPSDDEIAALIRRGQVFVDGQRVLAPMSLSAGARVLVHLVEAPEAPTPRVIFEDARILVIDKPPGLHVNETETSAGPSLVLQLKAHGALAVHRIDRETSGLVVMAKDAVAAEALSAAFAERRVTKRYAAVVKGRPADQTLEQPIGRDRRRPRARAVDPRGKPAETRITCLSSVEGLAAILAEPRTGRTHQIRVHLSHLGAPLVGDTLYGGPAAVRLGGAVLRPGRVLLHAARLGFELFGARHEFEAPLPPDLEALLPLGLALDQVYR